MAVDEILVLANSKKWGGRCVAGVSTRGGRWVRPVSGHPHGVLKPRHHRIDGRDLEPLDVVSFEHDGRVDDPSQPENVRVGSARWWLTGRVATSEAPTVLSPHLVKGPTLLGNRGAAMPEDDAMQGVDASLALIRPAQLDFCLESPAEGTSRPRPRARFELDGQSYDLALTDLLIRPRLLRAGLGAHDLADLGLDPTADILLTVSLAEAREGWCTKLVAAVIALPEWG